MTKIRVVLILLILVICGIIVFCIFNNSQQKNTRLDIVVTTYPLELIAKNLTTGVDNVSITNITKTSGGCVHEYELTTNDMMKIESSDVIFINGQDMEHFIEDVSLDDINVCDTSEGINDLQSSHVWMNISNYAIQANNVCEELCKLDEENSQKYIDNSNEYIEKLNNLSAQMKDIKKDVKVAILHDSLMYYADNFNITAKLFSAHEGNTSASELKEFIDLIKTTNTKIVLVDNVTNEENVSLINMITNEVDVQVIVIDLITRGDGNIDDYIIKTKCNMEIFKDAIK